MGHRSDLRRLERRQRRRRGGATRARDTRHRHGRLDPDPRGYCGVTGLRPTSGRVSEQGRRAGLLHASTRWARSRRAPRTAPSCSRRSRATTPRPDNRRRPRAALPARARARCRRPPRRRRDRARRPSRPPDRGGGTRGGRGARRVGAVVEEVDVAAPRGGRHDPAAGHAPGGRRGAPRRGCDRGSTSTEPTSAHDCWPGCCCPRRHVSRGGALAAGTASGSTACLGASTCSPRRRCPSCPRGSARTRSRSAASECPTGWRDPVQLTVDARRAPRRQRPVRLRRRPSRRAGARGASLRRGDRPAGWPRVPDATDWHERTAADRRLTAQRGRAYTPWQNPEKGE